MWRLDEIVRFELGTKVLKIKFWKSAKFYEKDAKNLFAINFLENVATFITVKTRTIWCPLGISYHIILIQTKSYLKKIIKGF